MKVEVRLFARARDAVGAERVTVELPAEARVGDLRAALAAGYPRLAPLAPSLLVAVGNEYAGDQAILGGQSEIACFPPVSGG
jgi:molybdopterin synthase sulfur carrier subunit